MRKKTLLLLIIIISIFSSCKIGNVPENEKNIFVRASDFSVYDITPANISTLEFFNRQVFFDGSKIYSYSFNSSENDPIVLYVTNEITFKKRALDTIIQYKYQKLGISIGTNIKNLDHLYSYGDESFFALSLNDNNQPVGNIFTFRKGKILYLLIISGVYFDNRTIWEEFISDKIQRLEILNK